MKRLGAQAQEMDSEGKENTSLDQSLEPPPRTKALSRQLLDYVGGLKGREFMCYAQEDWLGYHSTESRLLEQQRNASKVSRKNEAKREARQFQEQRVAMKTESQAQRRARRRAKRQADRKTRTEAAVTIQRTYRRHLNMRDSQTE